MKQFLILSNFASITYKDVFKLFIENKANYGYSKRSMIFVSPDGDKAVNAAFITSMDISDKPIVKLEKRYNPDEYQRYDNFDAIDVSKAKDIPIDYPGMIGVPVTFIEHLNRNQFDIVGISARYSDMRTKKYTPDDDPRWNDLNSYPVVVDDGKYVGKYQRIFIKHK